MSISSPLPTATFSSKPLQLTLSLETLAVPAAGSTSSSDSESETEDGLSASTDFRGSTEDVFDELDQAKSRIGGDARQIAAGSTRTRRERQNRLCERRQPLADLAHEIYPGTDLDLERLLSEETAGDNFGQLADWMKATSSKVTSIVTGNVYKQQAERKKDTEELSGSDTASGRKCKRTKRLAIGSEDGVVWIFRDKGETPRIVTPGRHQREATEVPSALSPSRPSEPHKGRPHRPSPTASRPSSPRTTLSQAGSPSLGASLSPKLTTRRSSASLSTLSSLTSQSAPRIASGPPSLNGSITTYSEVRSLPDQRLRKASATVSVSTTSITPAPAHRHSNSQSRNSSSTSYSDTHDENDASSLSLSPIPPSELPTYPLSPIPKHPAPQFRFSPSTPSDEAEYAFSSLAPSPRTLHSATSGLAGRKEHRSSVSESMSRSHSRGLKKESITNGIGLWEKSSSTTNLRCVDQSDEAPSDVQGEAMAHLENARGDTGVQDESWRHSDLEPSLKVLTPGQGPVTGLEVIKEDLLPFCHVREGQIASHILAVLRESGHLSLISLLDGKCLGSIAAGPGSFGNLAIVERKQAGPIALCTVIDKTSSLVCFDLSSLSVSQTLRDVSFYGVDSAHAPSLSLYYISLDSNRISSAAILTSADRGVVITPSEPTSAGILKTMKKPHGLRTREKLLVAWDCAGLSIAVSEEQGHLSQIATSPLAKVRDVVLLPGGERFVAIAEKKLLLYQVSPGADHWTVTTEAQYDVAGLEAVYLAESYGDSDINHGFLCAMSGVDRTRSLAHIELGSPTETHTLYCSPVNLQKPRSTRARKLDSESFLVGFSSGMISQVRTSSLGQRSAARNRKAQLQGAISVLDIIDLGGREVVLAGTARGAVGLWNLSNWEEIAGFSLFASPVLSYAKLSLPSHPHTLLFVSCNSPIALVSLHPPELLFTLPGSRTPVQLVATTKLGEILVLYRHGLARIWDAETGELRRSMDTKTAESVLEEKDKEWRTWFDADVENASAASASISQPSVSFDVRTALEDFARELPWSNSRQRSPRRPPNGFDSLDTTPDISRSTSPAVVATAMGANPHLDYLEVVKAWLANLIPFGLDQDSDRALEQLGIVRPDVQLVLACQQPRSLAFLAQPDAISAWTSSPYLSAQRLLLVTCLLRVFLNYPSTERNASEAIVHFSACLDSAVGPEFQRPSLEFFANYWLDKNPEIQQAAKTLFGTYLATLSNEDTLALVQEWEIYLPVRQVSRGSPHSKSDTAVLLIGLVAVDRFKLLSTPLLMELSTSIASYLDDSQHAFHQALATELCSKGFHIWQNYVDAMALVRQLFSIAIGRNPSTPSDLRAMARQATVHVAGVNSPLFMSTLLFDILNAPTVVSRNATLKLLGFIIRKKPLVLYHSLPRVVEAVVRSLDPIMADLRETVQQTATVILNELVRTFPSIDFHGKSQRLAVGTQEGSAIVYDLKTATRLYVLEGHRLPLTAVSWSSDGHRLATVSLHESKVCIWKTGMGILSLIGAPSQRAGSPPFKEWDFHVGDEALMTTAATLEWIIVDWPAERTVRLRIRETALSFGA